MSNDGNGWIGGACLAATYDLKTVMPLPVVNRIGGRRATRVVEEVATETYVEAMRPVNSLRGHLTFHLKHEVPHLELISRLFAKIGARELAAWVANEPTRQYARRAGFFYELLTGHSLDAELHHRPERSPRTVSGICTFHCLRTHPRALAFRADSQSPEMSNQGIGEQCRLDAAFYR